MTPRSAIRKSLPLPDRRRCQGHADQDGLIRGILRSLLHFSWPRAKSRHGELWLLVRANHPAVAVRRAENIRQRRSEHQRVRLVMARRLRSRLMSEGNLFHYPRQRSFRFKSPLADSLAPFTRRRDDRSAHTESIVSRRSCRIPPYGNRHLPQNSNRHVVAIYDHGAFLQYRATHSVRASR